MCIDSCVGFTGTFDLLDACPECSEPPYQIGARNSHCQYPTIPIGPIIQALYCSQTTAKLMHYLEEFAEKISNHAKEHDGDIIECTDTACGADFINVQMSQLLGFRVCSSLFVTCR